MRPGVLAVAMMAASATVLSFAQVSEGLKRKLDEAERNTHVENIRPVDIAPGPDAAEVAIRTIRNRLHNTVVPFQNRDCTHVPTDRVKKDGCRAIPTLEELPPGVPGKVTFVDLPPMRVSADQPNAAELPVSLSNTVLVGSVSQVQAYLSEDKTNIYTEYTIAVTEVLLNANGLRLNPGTSVALDRMGGALRLASGRVLRDVVQGQSAPLIAGHKYVLFLSYDARGVWFRCVKSWELWDGMAAPVDPGDVAAAQRGESRFAGTNETDFLNAVRGAVQRQDVQK